MKQGKKFVNYTKPMASYLDFEVIGYAGPQQCSLAWVFVNHFAD
jgi:hypothetical protein